MSDELEPTTSPAREDDSADRAVTLKVAVVFALLLGVVGVLLLNTGAGDAFVYSKLVHEVMEDPAAFDGVQLRVEGDLLQGSVQFREDPCEWRFTLEKEGHSMPVEFPQCVVPDTFRDDMGISVTVQGELRQDGVFLANEVVPRCPSKYEMNEREEAGEEAPHAMPAASNEGAPAAAPALVPEPANADLEVPAMADLDAPGLASPASP